MYRFPEDLRRAYEASPLSFVYYEISGGQPVPVLVSDGFCANVGMPRERALEWLGAGLFERLHPDDVGIMSQISRDFINHAGEYDAFFRCRVGEKYQYFHGLGKWQAMPDGVSLAVITYANMTATKDVIREKLSAYGLFQEDRFYKDPLTGLPNINFLNEFADERVHALRLEDKRPLLMFCDVKAMNFYNNQYGFERGNALLKLVAQVLSEAFPGAMVTRGAEDHFVLIDAYPGREDLSERIDRANRRIRREAFGDTTGIQMGLYVFEGNANAAQAIDCARNAVKQIASDLNETHRFYANEDDIQYWNQRYIVENLDRALENGWVKVYYQGIMRLETGKGAALEALARWIDPNRGLISPGEFIPVLDKYHLLYKLDLYMAGQVFREVPLRQAAGLPLLPVSVNFSAQDFDYTDVPAALNALYDSLEISKYAPKDCFIIEITEQDAATATPHFHDQLVRLKRDGYRLWLDDFGSGYSSLNVFSRFDFDLIKFDMEFLRNLDVNNGANRHILRALIGVAREMGIHTLVEGMESEEQKQFLKQIGCELAQGFLFYRPESLDSILFRHSRGRFGGPCETPEERRRLMQVWRERVEVRE